MTRLRGAIGIGLSWAIAWGGAGAIMVLGIVLATGSRPDPPFPLMFTVAGLLNGIVFSGVFALAEGGREQGGDGALAFDALRVSRIAAWGAAVGGVFATAFVLAVASGGDGAFVRNLVFLGPIFGAAAAGSAAGCLILARRTARWKTLFVQLGASDR